jgi:ABC-type nitrate/sulfonate/bicarbonate transport system permease component
MMIYLKKMNLWGLLPIVIVILFWQFGAQEVSTNFPAPSKWLLSLEVLFHSGKLVQATLDTILTFFIGLMISSLLGLVLGLAIGINPFIRNSTSLLLESLRALPPPVIIPIAVLLIGYSPSMKMTVIVLGTIWPILINVKFAVSQINLGLIDMAHTLRLSQLSLLRKIIIPAILPQWILGIRIATPLAIVITLLIEMLTGMLGLGGLMISGQRNYNSAQVFGILVIVGLLGLIINYLSTFLEYKILKNWPPKS